MKLFVCQSCGNVLYFENRTCGRCGHRLAFLPEKMTLSAVEGDGANLGASWKTLAEHRLFYSLMLPWITALQPGEAKGKRGGLTK